ncbi:MAG: flagellar hook capping FlgD N-terminal domain-containing protein, partial [Oscillospiraceae bacterium]
NQDVMNPSSDTEFIAQMAQFTSLQAMQTLTEINYASYGASMIGKKVVVASFNEKTGKLEKDTGFVSTVTLDGGTVNINVNGKSYPMSGVMEVLDPTTPDVKPDEKPDEKPDVKPDEKPKEKPEEKPEETPKV